MKKSKVVLIGNFDGIHLGHQKLISKAKKIAEQKKQKLVLITFNPVSYTHLTLPTTLSV